MIVVENSDKGPVPSIPESIRQEVLALARALAKQAAHEYGERQSKAFSGVHTEGNSEPDE